MCEQARKISLQKRFKSGTVSCQSCQSRLEDLMQRCAWKELKAWSRTSYKNELRGLPRDTTPSHPASSHECLKTQHGIACLGYREGRRWSSGAGRPS